MKTTKQTLADLHRYDIDENKRYQYGIKVASAMKENAPIPFAELEFEAMDFNTLTEVVQAYDISIDQLYAVGGRIPAENLEVTTKDGSKTLSNALMIHDKANNGNLMDTIINQMHSRQNNFYKEYKEFIDANDPGYFARYQIMKRGGAKFIKDALAFKAIGRADLENAVEFNIISADDIELEDIESNLELQDAAIFDYETKKKVTLYQYLQNRQKEKIKTDEHKYDALQARESEKHSEVYNAYGFEQSFDGEENIKELLSNIGPENIDEIKAILEGRIKNAQENNPIEAFDIMCSVMAEYMNSEGYRSTQIEEIYKACQEYYYGHQITAEEQQSAINLFEIPFAFLETHQVSGKVAMSQLRSQQQSEKENATKGMMLDEIFKLPCKQLAEKREALHQMFPKQEQFKGGDVANFIDKVFDLICKMFYSHQTIGKGYDQFAANYKGMESQQNAQTQLEEKLDAYLSIDANPRQSQIMSELSKFRDGEEKQASARGK